MQIVTSGFYTAVVLEVSTFETVIINEKHFGNREEAEAFKKETDKDNILTVIIKLD